MFLFRSNRTRYICYMAAPKSSFKDGSTINRRLLHFQSSVHDNHVDAIATTGRFPCWYHANNRPSTRLYICIRQVSSTNHPIDYQSLAVDRIVLDGDERISPDSSQAEAEVNLQRLANECKRDPNGPNLLVNMLEMMDNEDIQVSYQTMRQVFKQIVLSRNVKLLQKTENLIVRKYRQDPDLLRLLIVAYLHSNAPEQAHQLLMSWPYPAPALQSYRLVLTALSREGDHIKSFQLLQYLCQHLTKSPKGLTPAFSSPVNAYTDDSLLKLDRECYHPVLTACIKSSSDDAFSFAQRVMKLIASLSTQDQASSSNKEQDFVIAPNRTTYRLFITAWSKTRDTKERRLLQEKGFDWLRKVEEKAARNVERTASTVPQRSPDIQCYNVVMNVFANDGRYQETKELFHRLLDDFLNGVSHVQPDSVSIHTVLKAHSQAGTLESAEDAEKFLKWLERFITEYRRSSGGETVGKVPTPTSEGVADNIDVEGGRMKPKKYFDIVQVQPTARSYATLLAIWIKLGMPYRALAVLEKAEDIYRSLSPQTQKQRHINNLFRLDVICYQSLIHALYKMEPLSVEVALLAQDIIQRMTKVGYKPDLLTCNTVLSCWVKAGRPSDAELFHDHILKQDWRIQPDIVSYNTLIQGHCNSNDLDKAIEILKFLLDSSVVSGSLPSARVSLPNVRTFTPILSCLARQRTLHSARQAEELVLQMQDLHDSRNLDTMPTSFTYNVLLNCWASLCQIDPERSSKYSHRVEEILAGMKTLSEIQQPTVVSYNTALKTYRQNMVKAENLVEDMIEYGLKPNEKTWDALMDVLKHDKSVRNKEEKLAYLRQQYFPHMTGSYS
jgi:pentatricopeptide repeat protein